MPFTMKIEKRNYNSDYQNNLIRTNFYRTLHKEDFDKFSSMMLKIYTKIHIRISLMIPVITFDNKEKNTEILRDKYIRENFIYLASKNVNNQYTEDFSKIKNDDKVRENDNKIKKNFLNKIQGK